MADGHHPKLVVRSRVLSGPFDDEHDLELLGRMVREQKDQYPSWYCREPGCPVRVGWEDSSGYCSRHEGGSRRRRRPERPSRVRYAADGRLELVEPDGD